MVSLLLLIIGTLIILFSIIFIKYQSEQISESNTTNQNDNELVYTLESLEEIIDDINITFNSTISEMERKYEILESQIKQANVNPLEEHQTELEASVHNEPNDENTNNNIENPEDFEKKNEYINERSSKIIELKREGLSIPEIARELNMGIGEVMLILNLNKI